MGLLKIEVYVSVEPNLARHILSFTWLLHLFATSVPRGAPRGKSPNWLNLNSGAQITRVPYD